MNARLQAILSKHETNLNSWNDFIRYYQDQFVLPYNPEIVEDFLDEPINIESVLQQLLAIFVDYARKGGPWEKHESLEYGTGFSTGIICRKIDHPYIIGVDKTSVYFETPVAYPQAIHKMFDRFVQRVADYSRFGIFSYEESHIFDDYILSKHRGLLKKKIKGELADLLREYFVAKVELDADFDFGFLAINWPLHQFSMQQILARGCQAFETIHHLNIELWKKSQSRR